MLKKLKSEQTRNETKNYNYLNISGYLDMRDFIQGIDYVKLILTEDLIYIIYINMSTHLKIMEDLLGD